jgi:hypothetical protein
VNKKRGRNAGQFTKQGLGKEEKKKSSKQIIKREGTNKVEEEIEISRKGVKKDGQKKI